MAGAIREWLATDRRTVLACSALKQRYRDRLSGGRRGVAFVHLKGPIELIAARLAARKDHFMPLSLLPSQFAALEEPQSAVVVDIHDDPPTLVSTIKSTLRL
jgi:gluconokinase